jgi:hypothetical protein
MMQVNSRYAFSLLSFLFAVSSSCQAGTELLWSNGGFVTHEGVGFMGSDISLNSPGELNFAGQNNRLLEEPNPWFRIADNFTLHEAAIVESLSTYGYEPFASPPNWTSASLRIWSGAPNLKSSKVLVELTQDEIELDFTDVYRIFNGEAFDSTDRAVYEIKWLLERDSQSGISGISLEAGNYWIDWQVSGGQTGWANPVMLPNDEDPEMPFTIADNGLHLRPIGWVLTREVGIEIPFKVFGRLDGVFSDRFDEPKERQN